MLGLEGCTSLEELYLSHNGIPRLEGLATLTRLKASGARPALREGRARAALRLPAVCWPSGAGRAGAPRAPSSADAHPLTPAHPHALHARDQVLDVSSNRLEAVDNLGPLTRLEDLWLNDNLVPTLDGLDAALEGQRGGLTTLYLSGNPAAADPRYAERLLALLPRLAQLDDRVLPARGGGGGGGGGA
jgi:hypothetical protein